MILSRTRFRGLAVATLLVSSGLFVASCLTPPYFSDTPSIDFKSIKLARVEKPTGIYDTVTVTVSFKDGDGDLGLSNDETSPPYQYLEADGTTKNRYNNNYFFTPQILRNGVYKDTIINYGYDSRYPRLGLTSDRKEPLRGDLSFGLKFFSLNTFPANSKVRFRVSIVDRALHESNQVLTDPVTFVP